VIVIDELPPTYAEALRTELRAGRLSPRIIHAETVRAEEIPELLSQVANLPLAA